MTQAHNEFFIEKEQLPVDITLVSGEVLSGLLFVQPSWRRPSLVYDAPSILGVQDTFFPLQLKDGSTRLVAKAQVVVMRGSAPEPDSDQDAVGEPATVCIRCINGDSVTGRLLITGLAPNLRVLDFLNRTVDEFIPIHERDTTVLVNRRHIMLVTDESNGST